MNMITITALCLSWIIQLDPMFYLAATLQLQIIQSDQIIVLVFSCKAVPGPQRAKVRHRVFSQHPTFLADQYVSLNPW